ncbi:hypothetical protein [Longitalea luteola]|uniref:hypothetical protein n=1 Tax=Longitalea luteola TaxID=2812563 RepID=UPI001A96C964|nr:hypothetical protein [Longitalea luteola]
MKKFQFTLFNHTWKVIVSIVLAIGLLNLVLPARPTNLNASSAIAQPATTVSQNKPTADDNQKKREAESKAAFAEAYAVFMHPRCMNCHPSGDVPLQGDDSHLHIINARHMCTTGCETRT